ncbi:hypothetical protein BDV12DRAFT_183630 [Aspergillus spectabilis]
MFGCDYRQGSLRYLFFHGNHGDIPPPPQVDIEASIVVCTGNVYERLGCSIESILPAQPLVERLLKNVSVHALVLGEVPRHQLGMDLNVPDPFFYVAVLVLGRSDIRPCTASDREYLTLMMQAFVPRLVRSLAPVANEYLPGDARNLSVQLAKRIGQLEDNAEFLTFISMYRSRYAQKTLPRQEVVELCLLHIVKMPFELGSSIQSSLIRY